MEEDNIYIQDQIATSEQILKNALNYNLKPEATSAFFIELAEVIPDAPQPPEQSESRRRTSSIVNPYRLENSIQPEKDSLDSFVRKNISSLRNSVDINTSVLEPKRRPSVSSILVKPVSYETKIHEKRVTKEERNANNVINPEQINEGSLNKMSSDGKKRSSLINYSQKPQTRNNSPQHSAKAIVMPDVEPVSVDHETPFKSERRKSHKENKNNDKLKLVLSVEPMDEDDVGVETKNMDKNQAIKQSKNEKERSSMKNRTKGWERKASEQDDNDCSADDLQCKRNPYGGPTAQQVFVFGTKSDKNQTQDKKKKDLKGEVSDGTSTVGSNDTIDTVSEWDENYLGNEKTQRVKHKPKKDSYEVTIEKQLSNESRKKNIPRENQDTPVKGSPKEVNSQKYEDLITPVRVFPGIGSQKKRSNESDNQDMKGLEKKHDEPESEGKIQKNKGGEKRRPTKFISVKAPRSATKIITKRRYHISIPDEGKKETWFNVRFNFNNDNNIDMNYEGPVKIKNYYSTSNYI